MRKKETKTKRKQKRNEPGEDVGVVGAREGLLQFLQLVTGEGGAVAALLALGRELVAADADVAVADAAVAGAELLFAADVAAAAAGATRRRRRLLLLLRRLDVASRRRRLLLLLLLLLLLVVVLLQVLLLLLLLLVVVVVVVVVVGRGGHGGHVVGRGHVAQRHLVAFGQVVAQSETGRRVGLLQRTDGRLVRHAHDDLRMSRRSIAVSTCVVKKTNPTVSIGHRSLCSSCRSAVH